MAKRKKVVDFVTVEYMPELQRQLEEIAYNASLIKQLANTLVKRLKEFDCTMPEMEQRCSMCLTGRVFSEVKLAAEHAESSINSIDKAIISKTKPDAPPKQQPAEPKKRTRASKIKVIEAPKVEDKPKRARNPKEEKPAEPEKKIRKAKVSEDKPKEVVLKRETKKEKAPETEKPKRKKVKKDEDQTSK